MISKISTSILSFQIVVCLARYPKFQMIPLRGNLDTRIRKLETTAMDAIVVAAAGVRRIGCEDRISQYIPPETILPAIGQGALGIESRIDDWKTGEIIDFLNSPDSATAITAERLFLRRLEGGCQVPIAALGEIKGDLLILSGIVGSVDGKILLKETVEGSSDNPLDVGEELAEKLLTRGAGEVLRSILPTTH